MLQQVQTKREASQEPRSDKFKTRKAQPPKDHQQRLVMANNVATVVASHQNYKSDPFAYGRAHSFVMNGLLDAKDLEDSNPKNCPSI